MFLFVHWVNAKTGPVCPSTQVNLLTGLSWTRIGSACPAPLASKQVWDFSVPSSVKLPRPVPRASLLGPKAGPPRSRTWVLVTAAAATAPHRKAAAKSASSTRCNQVSAMAHRTPGSQPPKPRPRAQTRHFLVRIYSWRGGSLTAAGTASSPRAASVGPGGRCGRSWAISARSGRPGWARRARGKQSGRGARDSAARPDAQR